MAKLVTLAASLARPVARGYLTLTDAHGTLLGGVLRAKREGMPYGERDAYRGLQHILQLRLDAERRRREMCEYRIARRIKPLIERNKPSNAIYAEAHDVNGAEGFPLSEPEVNELAASEMFWALEPRRRRHG